MTATSDNPPGSPAPDMLSRAESPYSTREKVLRLLWNYFGQRIMFMTFHNWYGLRARWLRLFGANIGIHARIRPSVRVEQPWNLSMGDNCSIGDRALIYCLGKVTIGSNTTISQQAHVCAGTHDFTRPDLPLLRPPIVIEDDVWIAADAFVGPGITIGRGALLGARAAAFKDLEPWTIYGGNPARAIRPRPPFNS